MTTTTNTTGKCTTRAIGGRNKNQPKDAWPTMYEAMAAADPISARRVAQGYAPVGGVYLCDCGGWEHATVVAPRFEVFSAGAYMVGRHTSLTPAQVKARALAEVKAARGV
jgi:hypothetical protein